MRLIPGRSAAARTRPLLTKTLVFTGLRGSRRRILPSARRTPRQLPSKRAAATRPRCLAPAIDKATGATVHFGRAAGRSDR